VLKRAKSGKQDGKKIKFRLMVKKERAWSVWSEKFESINKVQLIAWTSVNMDLTVTKVKL